MAEVPNTEIITSTAPVDPVAEETEIEGKPEENKDARTYSQEDVDRIAAKIKKNERYRTKKEVEAYYQGRDSRPEPRQEVRQEQHSPERLAYESDEAFIEAKAEFIARKVASEERHKFEHELESRKSEETRQKTYSSFQEKVRTKFPDIEERMEEISHINLPVEVLQSIAESDVGPDILSHFADNSKECERIAALTPSAALREIGRLEARLEGDSKQEPVKISKAPSPINPGSGQGSTAPKKLTEMTQDEFDKKRRSQIAARR